jgi:hypothetical protein
MFCYQLFIIAIQKMDYLEITANDKTYRIRRVKRKDLTAFIEAYRKVLENFVYFNGAIGNVLAEEKRWNDLVNCAKFIPVDGQEKIGFDLSLIEDDYDTLIELFFSTSWNRDRNEYVDLDNGFKSSQLAKLNRIDYDGDWVKILLKVKEIKEKEIEKLMPPEKKNEKATVAA